MLLHRYYILKKSGKWRPIGAPLMTHRVLAKSLSDLIYLLFNDKFNVEQHGFRKKRSTVSALFDLWYRTQNTKISEIYEFDFRGFFNRVRPSWVYRMLLGRSRYLAEIIARVIINIDYKLHDLKEEAELKYIGMIRKGKRMFKLIEREGMPQGLNLSPLLSTLVLEILKAPKGLIMYADDGLFLAETEEDMKKFKK